MIEMVVRMTMTVTTSDDEDNVFIGHGGKKADNYDINPQKYETL